tara:strand:+ start:94 stop:477 length:384 start_codon:yes stop_codon:yes gene_type:complete
MIKDFLIINCTGKNDSIGLRLNNNFFIEKLQTNIKNNELLVDKIFNLLQKKKAKVNNSFSVIVNVGPGSFSTLRTSLAIAKGIKISKGSSIYGYKNSILKEFNLKNIEFLIKNNLLENKLIKPQYLS